MSESPVIEKNKELRISEDYYELRKKGIEFIEKLGSDYWTDYNLHDPGITILEYLCYALTDLAYRASFDIKDKLAEENYSSEDYLKQGFFTAREILTSEAWIVNDFRKMLIDLQGVQNAWIKCRDKYCSPELYIDCKKKTLTYDKPLNDKQNENRVNLKGLYDVAVEFEGNLITGDLNSGKIKYSFNYEYNNEFIKLSMETRFPSWKKILDMNNNKYLYISKGYTEQEIENLKYLGRRDCKIKNINVDFISGNEEDNKDIEQEYLGSALKRPMFATFKLNIEINESIIKEYEIKLIDIPFNFVYLNDGVRKKIELEELKNVFKNNLTGSIFQKYLEKLKEQNRILNEVKNKLHDHRNLCEDYCEISGVDIEEFAICTDIEVENDSDIERVLAEAFVLIDDYFNPRIKFQTLNEMRELGLTTEEIFAGPKLIHGFISDKELETTEIRKTVYSSDIINILMDIKGVKAVKNFVIVRFDEKGNRIQTEPWVMNVKQDHVPRFYPEMSKFLVYKDDLPFLPDLTELYDTISIYSGQNSKPKMKDIDLDIEISKGKYYKFDSYEPIQNTFPLTYGIGYEGLPSNASELRKAQAIQLKSYLLFFEQLLVNYLSQLANSKCLFSLDNLIDKTYFIKQLTNEDIDNIENVYKGLTELTLHQIIETEERFYDRRHRFLNHQLARFGETFSNYALLLYSYLDHKKLADELLLENKISFLKNYPKISSKRALSINYKTVHNCDDLTKVGLMNKLNYLLGLDDYLNFCDIKIEKSGVLFKAVIKIVDKEGYEYLTFNYPLIANTEEELSKKINKEIKQFIDLSKVHSNYEIFKKGKKYKLVLKAGSNTIGISKNDYSSESEAKTELFRILDFCNKYLHYHDILFVEHILLRPRNKKGEIIKSGDPLMELCITGDCRDCGDDDPYSFRLTVVINAETGIGNYNLNYRKYAEKVIRMELPAHIVAKICWVSSVQYSEFKILYCDWLKANSSDKPDKLKISNTLKNLINYLSNLKNIYPPATLHDCIDGDDDNRTFLNKSVL